MAIEAPITNYRKTNFKIYIVVCILGAIIFAYDGYLSQHEWSGRYSFYEKHVVNNENTPDDYMLFNQKAPMVLCVLAVILAVRFYCIKDKKLVADENELIFSEKDKIAYDSIEKIDKSMFESEGFFAITYKNEKGNEVDRKVSTKAYDNLSAILDEVITKIS